MYKLLASLRVPVVLAPMAGVSTPTLVAAGCNSGIFGIHGGAFRDKAQLEKDIKEIKCLTDKAYGVNVFAHPPPSTTEPDSETRRVENARQRLKPFYEKVGISMPLNEVKENHLLSGQMEVLLQEKVPLVSYCFGFLDKESVKTLQNNGSLVIGTATSVEEAALLKDTGVDAITVQGAEAGGHRGSFLPNSSLVGLFSLLPQVVDEVGLETPVIAAGGIGDARGIRAALCLGAGAVAMGTKFITSSDSAAADIYKNSILNAKETDTLVTDVFSGRSARGLVNEFVETYDEQGLSSGNHNKQLVLAQQTNVARYPIQQQLTNPRKKSCVESGLNQYMSMWCGQSPRFASTNSVKVIVQELVDEL